MKTVLKVLKFLRLYDRVTLEEWSKLGYVSPHELGGGYGLVDEHIRLLKEMGHPPVLYIRIG